MATLRYTCTCSRYLSPTRLQTVNKSHRHRDLGLYQIHCHSAPTSPARWRSTTSSSARFRNATSEENDQQQMVTTTPDEALQTRRSKRGSLLQGKLFRLRMESLSESLKDVREWTAVNAPRMDAKAVAKLMSSLNIDLPKYQRFLTRKARAIATNHDVEVDRVKREQLEEKKARLLKRMEAEENQRETHDLEQALLSTQECIQHYYSLTAEDRNANVTGAPTDRGIVNVATQPLVPEITQANILTQAAQNDPKEEDKAVKKEVIKVVDQGAVARAAVDKRTRGLVTALLAATTNASVLHRLEDLCLHLSQYTKFAKNVAIKERVIPYLLKLQNSKDKSIAEHSLQALHLVGHVEPVRGRGVRVLTIDGGGTRGLVALEMLRQLEEASGKPIHEMFDYVCGVSTGALIAVMIGAFQRPVDECERLYKEFSREMFGRNRFLGASKLVTTHAYYDTKLWEDILKENIGLDSFIETMKNKRCPKLCLVSSLVNQRNMENFLFRNYTHATGVQSKYRGSIQYRLWEGIRASSAAPGYYEELKLGENIHQDGGLLTNNPAAIAIHECKLLWPNEKLQCVISVGTGRYRPTEGPAPSYKLKDKLLKIVQSATDTEAVHTILHDLLPPSTYFRFNPYMSDEFLLDEISEDRWELMKQDTLMYCRKNEAKLNTAGQQLRQTKMPHQKAADWIRNTADRMS